MKLIHSTILIWLFLFLSFSSLSQEIQFSEQEQKWIENHPIIEFGYDHRWEPYEIYSVGQYGGIISDYIRIIEDKTKLDFRPIPDLTWAKSLEGFTNESIMILPNLVATPARRKQFILSKPYIEDPIVIVASKNANYFSTLDDLKGKTISISESFYTVELIRQQYPDINIKEYENIQKCFAAITNGEADAFVGKLNVITYYINHYGFDNVRIVGVTPFQDNGICFAVHSKDKILIDIINRVILQITPEQKHEIRERWVAGKSREIYSSLFIFWTTAILIGILTILVIVFFWNRLLNKKLKRRKKTEQQLKSLLLEVKKSDEEKKVLLQEIHHRVKNNLQIVSSMLNLQANTTSDHKTRQVLKEAMDRVSSIALVHKKMYQSPNESILNLKGYIEALFEEVSMQYQNPNSIELIIDEVEINSKMETFVPLALILNELISNSLNYAFHSQNKPVIKIEFKTDNLNCLLEMIYSDNGSWIENEKSDKFGTSMIEIFTEQIDGNYNLIKTSQSSTFIFRFEQSNIK